MSFNKAKQNIAVVSHVPREDKINYFGKQVLWDWINERHHIYLRRQAGKPAPWTNDPILQKWFFTNVFRPLDKVSLDVKREILDYYRPWKKEYAEPLVRDVIAYRLFNLPATWQKICPLLDDWDEEHAIRILERAQARGETIVGSAYVIPNGGKSVSKARITCERLTAAIIMVPELVKAIRANRTLENATEVMRQVPLCNGTGFIAYEFVSDLRWTPLLSDAPDIMTWANPGPGAIEGLKFILGSKPQPWEAVLEMRMLLKESRQPGVLGKHVPPLEMRDIEHSLCEVSKYVRVASGKRGKRRYISPAATKSAVRRSIEEQIEICL